MGTRRSFLAGLTSATCVPAIGWGAVGNPTALSAAMTRDGHFLLVGLTASGDIAFRVPLPARGHAAAAHPMVAEAVAIARRPGTFAMVIDCATGRVIQSIHAPKGRHFYGHGAFSADGSLLFTPENEVATGQGRIGVWDRGLGYARIDEFASGGIGPHEILRLPTGDLAVANGGIRTHPETGREKLNLDSMQANLSVYSPTGTLRDRAEVAAEYHHNSLRHIAVSSEGVVICGFQWQGDPYDPPPLVALYDGKGTLYPCQIEDDVLRALDGYIGSVCAVGQTRLVASSPRGGRVLTFNMPGEQTGVYPALDVCGLSAAPGGDCLVTDGLGTVYALASTGLQRIRQHDLAFDNHLVALL
ncbi:MAG: DUF1513 domain-containing protein [Pseudomonadota bacterium]